MVGSSILLRKRHQLIDKSLAIVSMFSATLSVGSAIATEFVTTDSMMDVCLILLTAFLVTFATAIDRNYCADLFGLLFEKYVFPMLSKTVYRTRDIRIITICAWFTRVALLALSFLFFTVFWFVLMIVLNKR
jgi:hypothetical protein